MDVSGPHPPSSRRAFAVGTEGSGAPSRPTPPVRPPAKREDLFGKHLERQTHEGETEYQPAQVPQKPQVMEDGQQEQSRNQRLKIDF